jgi:hypothetical protein
MGVSLPIKTLVTSREHRCEKEVFRTEVKVFKVAVIASVWLFSTKSKQAMQIANQILHIVHFPDILHLFNLHKYT